MIGLKFLSAEKIKVTSLILTAVLFVIPYIYKNCYNNLILILSGITLTLYIVSAVFEEYKKTGCW